MKDDDPANIFDFASKKGSKSKKSVSKEHSRKTSSLAADHPISPVQKPPIDQAAKDEYPRRRSSKKDEPYKPPPTTQVPINQVYHIPSEPELPPNKASKFRQNFEKKNYTDTELTQTLEKISKMRRDLEKKLEDLYEQSGMSREQLQSYMENPQNVGTPMWDRIQQRREELSEKLSGMIGAEEKIRATAKKTQEADKITKNRKGKTLGNRKKWIPIR